MSLRVVLAHFSFFVLWETRVRGVLSSQIVGMVRRIVRFTLRRGRPV